MTSLTENGALAHHTTYSNLIDLFVKSVRKCPSEEINRMCRPAWNENPHDLVALTYLTRDPRNGKGERDVSYAMLKWLKNNKPKTYNTNISTIVETYGRYDDYLKLATTPSDIEYKLFAEALKRDLTVEHPSLAVKWAPRESNDPDAARILAKILFPKDKHALSKYRKEILAPLAKKVTILETLMCQNKWDEINYEHVPSQAMKLYGRKTVKSSDEKETREGAFLRHDKERFAKYREDVSTGKAKVNVAGLEPHKLIKAVMTEHDPMIENQWNTMIKQLQKNVSLSSAMALVDVSGSMDGEPMEVALAFGLVVATLTPAPFDNKFITFHENPELVSFKGNTLYEKVNSAIQTSWGGSTDIVKAFDLILNTARMFDVPPEKMVKTLFVFTDMQFNCATSSNEKTVYEHVSGEFKKYGYTMPQLVFWNLRYSDNDAFPVTISEFGTAFVSGFSPILLKAFTDCETISPIYIFKKMIEKYDEVAKVDDAERV